MKAKLTAYIYKAFIIKQAPNTLYSLICKLHESSLAWDRDNNLPFLRQIQWPLACIRQPETLQKPSSCYKILKVSLGMPGIGFDRFLCFSQSTYLKCL